MVARGKAAPGKREAFLAAARAVIGPTRGEAGCLSYRASQDVEDDHAFTFVEEWRDRAALEAHFQTPHVKALFAALPGILAGPAEVKIHEVARTEVTD
ncbi:MAG TPA: putative quinol monooxygenase [Planctomycetota bacterium]|nr:putative quinol monooxygenase [Planctomycetota bacterium]